MNETGINVLKIAPESAIKFAAYEKVKRLIRQNDQKQLGIYERLVNADINGQSGFFLSSE